MPNAVLSIHRLLNRIRLVRSGAACSLLAMNMLKPNPRSRTLLAAAISVLPTSSLRVMFYRLLFRYELGAGTRIGPLTVIACASFRCGASVHIGRNNTFIGPFSLEIGENVIIGRFNKFVCGNSAADPRSAKMNYRREMAIGDRALIHDSHYFDIYGMLRIGAGSWIAGIGSQFWTHGASVMDRDISIGSECYVGSSVRFAPGSSVADRCVVGLGSVVVGKHAESDVVLSGVPAKVVRSIQDGETRQFVFEAY
jgi:acetyltransferase-like isoleucine patch superfamily enzyme